MDDIQIGITDSSGEMIHCSRSLLIKNSHYFKKKFRQDPNLTIIRLQENLGGEIRNLSEVLEKCRSRSYVIAPCKLVLGALREALIYDFTLVMLYCKEQLLETYLSDVNCIEIWTTLHELFVFDSVREIYLKAKLMSLRRFESIKSNGHLNRITDFEKVCLYLSLIDLPVKDEMTVLSIGLDWIKGQHNIHGARLDEAVLKILNCLDMLSISDNNIHTKIQTIPEIRNSNFIVNVLGAFIEFRKGRPENRTYGWETDEVLEAAKQFFIGGHERQQRKGPCFLADEIVDDASHEPERILIFYDETEDMFRQVVNLDKDVLISMLRRPAFTSYKNYIFLFGDWPYLEITNLRCAICDTTSLLWIKVFTLPTLLLNEFETYTGMNSVFFMASVYLFGELFILFYKYSCIGTFQEKWSGIFDVVKSRSQDSLKMCNFDDGIAYVNVKDKEAGIYNYYTNLMHKILVFQPERVFQNIPPLFSVFEHDNHMFLKSTMLRKLKYDKKKQVMSLTEKQAVNTEGAKEKVTGTSPEEQSREKAQEEGGEEEAQGLSRQNPQQGCLIETGRCELTHVKYKNLLKMTSVSTCNYVYTLYKYRKEKKEPEKFKRPYKRDVHGVPIATSLTTDTEEGTYAYILEQFQLSQNRKGKIKSKAILFNNQSSAPTFNRKNKRYDISPSLRMFSIDHFHYLRNCDNLHDIPLKDAFDFTDSA